MHDSSWYYTVALEGIITAFSGMNTHVDLYFILYLDTIYKIYMTTLGSGLFPHNRVMSNNSLSYFFIQSYSVIVVYDIS